ncbi:hypothetical protein IJ843_07305 [bacterium]|nr:hypothetical protein [bacterium]
MDVIRFEHNLLYLPDTMLTFDYEITQAIVAGESVIVLLDIPPEEGIYRNIYSFGFDTHLIWQIQDVTEAYPQITHQCTFVGISPMENGNVLAVNFFGINFEVSVADGKILAKHDGR